MRHGNRYAAAAFPEVRLTYGGHGLCSACYHRRHRAAKRGHHRHDDVLDEYVFLTTDTGLTRRDIAARLGIGVEALQKHLRQARKRDDPRARKVIPL